MVRLAKGIRPSSELVVQSLLRQVVTRRKQIFSKLRTLATEVVEDKPDLIVFKMRHEYTLKVLDKGKAIDSLISLGLDENGKVKYHKDMWYVSWSKE